MTPMSEERLNELDSWGGKLVSEAQRFQGFGELVRELRRLRDVPPEVAAAMERITNPNLRQLHEDQWKVVQHFTTLFTKGNQP